MLSIIYENSDFMALYKPAGVLVHGIGVSHAKNEETVVDWVLERYPEVGNVGDDPKNRPGIVHRLDKNTSGVMVIARNQKFFDYLKNLFQEHLIKKTYLALVFGDLTGRGIINKPIGLKSGTIKRSVSARRMKMLKEAITEYKTIKNFGDFSLVRLFPKTGRTHQIRVHLASIGHPIVGDGLYSKKENPWNLKRQFLHAESIEFSMPDGQRIKLETDLPEDLKKILEKLENKVPLK